MPAPASPLDDPALLRQALDALSVPLALQDAKGHVQFANAKLRALLAKPLAQIVGQSGSELFACAALQPFTTSRVTLGPVGATSYVLISWRESPTTQRLPQPDDSSESVTDDPQAHARVLGQLASLLAHQIRNPLGAISNALALMRRHLHPDSSEITREALSIAQEEVWVANRAIGDVLEYARTGQSTVYPAPGLAEGRLTPAEAAPAQTPEESSDMKEEVKRRMMAAMKSGDVVEKEILRVLRGELDTAESRQDGPLTQEASEKIVRKLIKSNEETLQLAQGDEQRETLTREIAILLGFLPKLPSAEEIAVKLGEVADQIKAAGNDGQATGIAMKHLKSLGVAVDGKSVAQAVKSLRG
jgi:uncharacterized protein YqeY